MSPLDSLTGADRALGKFRDAVRNLTRFRIRTFIERSTVEPLRQQQIQMRSMLEEVDHFAAQSRNRMS